MNGAQQTDLRLVLAKFGKWVPPSTPVHPGGGDGYGQAGLMTIPASSTGG